MSSKIKVDTIENVAGSGNVSLGSGHNLVVPGNITGSGNLTVDTNTLHVNGSSNRVGIGTTSPSYPLTISHASTAYHHSTNGTAQSIFGVDSANTNIMGSLSNHDIRFITNTTEQGRITTAGLHTKPNQPSFAAYSNNGNWVTTTQGNQTTITFNNTFYNVGSHFKTDAGTGQYERFTAPVAGKYVFHLKTYVRLETLDDDSNHGYTRIRVNGSAFMNSYNIFGYNNSGDSDQNADLTIICNLAANDYVHCDVSAASGSMSFYNSACVFMGYMLG